MPYDYEDAQPTLHLTTAKGEPMMLRPAAPEDVDLIFEACRDPESIKWTTLPLDYQRDRAVGFIEEYAPSWWANRLGACWVVADGDGRYVGQIDLRVTKDPEVADVGFLMSPQARGRGFMTAATRAAAEFGLRELGLRRVEWKAHVGNEASRRVAEKAGFQFEGVLRRGCASRGERFDCWIAALIKEDLI